MSFKLPFFSFLHFFLFHCRSFHRYRRNFICRIQHFDGNNNQSSFVVLPSKPANQPASRPAFFQTPHPTLSQSPPSLLSRATFLPTLPPSEPLARFIHCWTNQLEPATRAKKWRASVNFLARACCFLALFLAFLPVLVATLTWTKTWTRPTRETAFPGKKNTQTD